MAHEQHRALVERGREIVQASDNLYIDLDVESDGIAGLGSLLSVGAVSPWGETFYRELIPADERFIEGNKEFCEQHGLARERLVKEGVPPREAMYDLARWQQTLRERYAKTGKSVLVAFNASYDFPLIDLEYKRAAIDNPFGVAGYCVKSLAMALGGAYDWRTTSKSKLPPDVIPDGEFTHNALEDAVYQQALHFAMVGKLHL